MSDFATNTKKPWSREEDALLAKLVASHGTNNWTGLAELLSQQTQSLIRGNGGGMMGTTRRGIMVPLELQRSGKQCRERWHNHVNPTVRKGEWTSDEDALIVALQKQLGNQWAKIAKHLNGRSDNAVKNRFHAIIRARTSQHPVSTTAHSSSSASPASSTMTPGSKLGTPGTVSSTATTVSNAHYHHLLHQHQQQQPTKSRRIDTFSPLAAHASHSYHSQQQQLPPTPSHINMNVNMNVYINSQRNKHQQDSSATPHAGHATYVKPEVVTAIPILDDAYIKQEKRKMPSLTIEAPTHTYQQQQQQQQQAYHTRSQAKTPTSSQQQHHQQQQQHLSSQSFGAFMCATPTHAHGGNPFMMFSHQHQHQQGHHQDCFDMYCARTQTQSTSPVPALTSLLTLSPVTVDEDFLQYWCVDDDDEDDDDVNEDVEGVDEEKQQDMQEPVLLKQQHHMQQQQMLNNCNDSSHSMMDVDVCMVDVMCVDLDMLVDHAQSHAHVHVSELMF